MESIKFKRKPFPVSESVRQKWNHIKTKGPIEQGVDPNCNLDILLSQPWFSHAKYDKARTLAYNNKAYLKVSPTPGIIMLLQIPVILTPLLHTKRSESLPLLFYRYLDTALEVLSWLEFDFTNKNTEGYRALQRVRNKHINVTKIMENVPIPEETLKRNPNTVWINQYSMAITEWAFFALFLMYPEKCGFHSKNNQEKEDLLWSLNYLWRIIGFALGMKDEFNIAQEDYKETIEMGHLILEEVYLPAITASHMKENPGYYMGLDVLTVLEDTLLHKTK